jgi:hypothetical protein
MKEGVTTTVKRRKGERLAAPLMGGCPLSPTYMLDILLFSQHLMLPRSRKVVAPNLSWLSKALPDC